MQPARGSGTRRPSMAERRGGDARQRFPTAHRYRDGHRAGVLDAEAETATLTQSLTMRTLERRFRRNDKLAN